MTIDAFTSEEKELFAVANASAIIEAEVQKQAEKTLNVTAQRHGVPRDLLKQEVVDRAYREARQLVKHERQLKADPGYQALQVERDKVRQLELQVEAMRMSQPIVRNESGNAGHARSSKLADSEIVRAQLGDAKWNALTIEGRLVACGIPPATVTAATKEEAKNIFGRNPDSKRASDMYKTNPSRYRELKAIAYVLNIVGN